MSRPRLMLPRARWAERVDLEPAEQRHMVDVLRLAPGHPVEVFDGQGAVCPARLQRSAQGWWLELGPASQTLQERPQVWLGLSLLKGRKLDEVVRMVTEVGVAGVIPFMCRRSVARPDSARSAARIERWRTIAEQAARQSGRTRVPRIEPLVTFAEFVSRPLAGLGVLLHESGGQDSLQEVLRSSGQAQRTLLVGPEGGFTGDEVEQALAGGFQIVHLDLPVLRADTAALVAAAFACCPVPGDPERPVETSS